MLEWHETKQKKKESKTIMIYAIYSTHYIYVYEIKAWTQEILELLLSFYWHEYTVKYT